MHENKTIYLIDFENVHDSGINNPESLNQNDCIYIFYTNGNDKLSTSTVDGLNKSGCQYELISVPSGDQSLDMHLVSFLGFLIGKHISEDISFIIVSKDKDYDNIIEYWIREFDIDIKKQEKLFITKKEKPVVNQPKNIQGKTKKAASATNANAKLNKDIQQEVSKFYSGKTPNEVASIVIKHITDSRPLNGIHNELRQTYSLYSEIYILVKPIVEKYLKNAERCKSTSVEFTNESLNLSIQQALKKGNYPAGIYNSVASIVCKHLNDQKRKQVIYREIISKYGQKTGLDIYHRIKNQL